MNGIITDIKSQKKDTSRVSIFVNGVYAFSVSQLDAARFSTGQRIAEKDISALKKENDRHVVYRQAVSYLARSPRSALEIRQYLKRKGHDADVVSHVVSSLVEKKYIDDKAFAMMFVENRERFRPRSRFALSFELRQKGIDDAIIDQAIENIDEDQSAWNAVKSKLSGYKRLAPEKLKNKVLQFLSNRGFNYEIAQKTYEKVLEKLGKENPDPEHF